MSCPTVSRGRGLTRLCLQPLLVAPSSLSPTTSVIAGGVGASLPARPAADFLAFIDHTGSKNGKHEKTKKHGK